MFNPLILFLLIPVLIAAFALFDRLVRLEYSSYRKHWEADGRPHGFFWVPAESKSAGGWLVGFGSSAAFHRCTFSWLFSTPDWMRTNNAARRLIFWLRVLVVTWNIALVGAVLVHLFL
jgi:hypothetical protein